MESINEQYGRAASALATAARRDSYHSVIFSSATRGEGTTSAVLHTGRYLKERLGLKPLLIELNRLRPDWCRRFELDPARSLAAIASGRTPAHDCIQENRWGLSLIPVGDFRPGDGACRPLDTVLCLLLQELASNFDMTLLDAPPMLECADALVAGRVIPRMILVVQAGHVSHEVLHRVQHELEVAGIATVGSILNKQQQIIPRWLYRWLTR